VAVLSGQPQLPFGKQRWPRAHVVVPQVQMPALHVPALPASQSALASHSQTDALHTKPGAQTRPQAPQLSVAVSRSRHPPGVWQQTSLTPHAAPLLQRHA
jgi:hypothetical protein